MKSPSKKSAEVFTQHSKYIEPLVARRRLIDRIGALVEAGFGVICGFPGSGRRTLVKQWISAQSITSIWLTYDVRTQLYETRFASKDLTSLPDSPLWFPTTDGSFKSFEDARSSTMELISRSKSSGVLILVDLPDADLSARGHGSNLTTGLQGWALLVIEPSPVFSERLADQLKWIGRSPLVIDSHDLMMREDEARQLFRLIRPGHSEEQVLSAVDAMSGWAKGLVAMACSSSPDESLATSNAYTLLTDYFGSYLPAKLGAAEQRALVALAVLEDINLASPLAAYLGQESLRDLWTALSHHCEFIHAVSSEHFLMHTAFARFIRVQFGRGDVYRELEASLSSMIGLAASTNRIKNCVDLLRACSTTAAVAALETHSIAVLSRSGGPQLVIDTLGRLSDGEISENPRLLLLLATCLQITSNSKAFVTCQRAVRQFLSRGDDQGFRDAIDRLSSIALESHSAKLLSEAIDTLNEASSSQHSGNDAAKVELKAIEFMLIRARDGSTKQASRLIDEILLEFDSGVPFRIRTQPLGSIVHWLVWTVGRPGQAALLLDKVLQSRMTNNLGQAEVMKRYAEAARIWMAGQHAEISCTVASLGVNATPAEQFCAAVSKRVLSTSSTSTSATVISILRNQSEGTVFPGTLSRLARVATLITDCQWADAKREASMTLTEATHQRDDGIRVLAQLALGALFSELSDWSNADSAYDSASMIAKGSESTFLEYLCSVEQAVSQCMRGTFGKALTSLHLACERAKLFDYSMIVWHSNNSVRALCSLGVENSETRSLSQKIVKSRFIKPASRNFRSAEYWPWSVRVFSLGKFSVSVEATQSGGRRYESGSKPMTLLKAIITFGRRGSVPADFLCGLLWPDSDGDLDRGSFDTTLHRLRKILSNEDAIRLQNGVVVLDENLIWVDSWALDAILTQAAMIQADKDQHFPLLLRACHLYHGHLFENENLGWAITERESLKKRMVIELQRGIDACIASDDWLNARYLFEFAVRLEPYSEALYLAFMRAASERGRYVEAIALFRRLRLALHAHLAISPSVEAERLRARILELHEQSRARFLEESDMQDDGMGHAM